MKTDSLCLNVMAKLSMSAWGTPACKGKRALNRSSVQDLYEQVKQIFCATIFLI